MDFQCDIPALLKVQCYKQKIREIELRSEIKHEKIKRAEKERADLLLEIELLEKEKKDLELRKIKNTSKLGSLKSKITDLNKKNSHLSEISDEFSTEWKNADAMLWETTMSTYSEIINYCDKVQESYEKYNFSDFLGKLLYDKSGSNQSVVPLVNSKEKKAKKVEELKEKKAQLMVILTSYKNRHQQMQELLEKRTKIKYEPLEGREFIELKMKLADSKELSRKLSSEISKIELIRNEKSSVKQNMPSETFGSNPELHTNDANIDCCASIQSSNNAVSNLNEKALPDSPIISKAKTMTPTSQKKSKITHQFVPKVGRYSRPSSIK